MPGFAEVEANLKRVAAVGITATEAIEAMRFVSLRGSRRLVLERTRTDG